SPVRANHPLSLHVRPRPTAGHAPQPEAEDCSGTDCEQDGQEEHREEPVTNERPGAPHDHEARENHDGAREPIDSVQAAEAALESYSSTRLAYLAPTSLAPASASALTSPQRCPSLALAATAATAAVRGRRVMGSLT